MTVVAFRIFFVYFLITLVMRIMGKRQVGELEISELVSALLLSEIAAIPVANPDLPILYAVLPMVTIVCFEIIITYLKNKFPAVKRVVESKPSFLICRGHLDQAELGRMRISVEEFMSELRILGVADPADVQYAILEQDGKMSVVLKREKQPFTVGDAEEDNEKREHGIAHALVVDGVIKTNSLRLSGKSEAWLRSYLQKENLDEKDVFLLTVDDAGDVHLIKKKEKKG